MKTESTEYPVWAQRWIWIIIIIALFLRVPAAFYLGDRVGPLPGIYDQISYDALAQSVVSGKGFTFETDWYPFTPAHTPTAHWSFLYTLYLAGVYRVFGYHPLVARLLQALVSGSLMCYLVYRLGRRVLGPTVGLVGAGLAAVYAYFVYYSVALVTESFFIVAVLAALDAALELAERPTWKKRALLGLALGIAALLRQVVLPFVPVLFIWLLWAGRGRVRSWDLAVPVAIIVILITPWTVRNYMVYQHFLPLNSNAGYAFYTANHPHHGTNFESLWTAPIPAEWRGLNEAELNDAFMREGLRFVVEDPWRYVLLSLNRIKDYFKFWPSAESGLISNISRVLSFGLCLPFMIYGLVISLRCWRRCLLLYLFVAAYTLIHLLSWSLIRYRLPVDAVLIVFAALALVDIATALANRRNASQPSTEP